VSADAKSKRPQIAGLYRLMEGYVDGDRRAFGELHDRLTPRLRGFLMRLVRNESAVDDLVQLTMLKAHLARDRFRLQGGDPDGAVAGWYFAIARNVAMDHLRKRTRTERRTANAKDASDPVAGVADDAPSIEALATDAEREREIIDRVREAIAKLPPGQREVVELHKLQGMSMADVAQRLQIREGAVRVRAHRGYKALARLLSPGSSGATALLALERVLDMIGGGA
jgi:RNA polymerase sigma-70 factor (ECF subfamily)